LGYVDQPAPRIGLPQPVAGIVLEFLEQQRDDLGLALVLQLRPQIALKQIAAGASRRT